MNRISPSPQQAVYHVATTTLAERLVLSTPSTMPLPHHAETLLLCRCSAGPWLDDQDNETSMYCQRCRWRVGYTPRTFTDPSMLYAKLYELQTRLAELEDQVALDRERRPAGVTGSAGRPAGVTQSSVFVPERRVSSLDLSVYESQSDDGEHGDDQAA